MKNMVKKLEESRKPLEYLKHIPSKKNKYLTLSTKQKKDTGKD